MKNTVTRRFGVPYGVFMAINVIPPLTTRGHAYPWRVPCRFHRRARFVAVDQLRAVDTERLVKRLGRLDSETVVRVLRVLQEMFAD